MRFAAATSGAQAGLTLVEVLVAVVLCGAGLAIVAAGISSAIRGEAYAQNLVCATDHVELVLARLQSGVLPLEDAEGDFSEDGDADLLWEVVVDNTDVEGLQLMTVTVRWESQGALREMTVEREIFVDPLVGGVR